MPKPTKATNVKYYADLIRDYWLLQDALQLATKVQHNDLMAVSELKSAAKEFETEFSKWDLNQYVFSVELPEDYFNQTCKTTKTAIEKLKDNEQFAKQFEPLKDMRYQTHEFLFYGAQFNRNFNKFLSLKKEFLSVLKKHLEAQLDGFVDLTDGTSEQYVKFKNLLDKFDQASSPIVMSVCDAILFANNLTGLADWIHKKIESAEFNRFMDKLTEWTTYINKYESLRNEIAKRYKFNEANQATLTPSENEAVEFFLMNFQQPYQRITKLPLFGNEFKKLMTTAFPTDEILQSKMQHTSRLLKDKVEQTNKIKGEKDCYIDLKNEIAGLADQFVKLTNAPQFSTRITFTRGRRETIGNGICADVFKQLDEFCRNLSCDIERNMPLDNIDQVQCNRLRDEVCEKLFNQFFDCKKAFIDKGFVKESRQIEVMYKLVAPILNAFFAKSENPLKLQSPNVVEAPVKTI